MDHLRSEALSKCVFIHPSIHYITLVRIGAAGAGAYPSMHWARGWNTPRKGRQTIAGHTHTIHSHAPT
uniref:Uncharacterized protein n=1 Tax=Anguilla anguilla TaxID=7936 RepID=A0A0E9XV32_ANGAN